MHSYVRSVTPGVLSCQSRMVLRYAQCVRTGAVTGNLFISQCANGRPTAVHGTETVLSNSLESHHGAPGLMKLSPREFAPTAVVFVG